MSEGSESATDAMLRYAARYAAGDVIFVAGPKRRSGAGAIRGSRAHRQGGTTREAAAASWSGRAWRLLAGGSGKGPKPVYE